MYRALSKEHNLTLMPFLLEGVVLNPKLNIDDGKHPNPEGVKIIAKNLAPYILKEIKNNLSSTKSFIFFFHYLELAADTTSGLHVPYKDL